MKKKVLIIGASGSLGQELMKSFEKDYDLSGTYSKRFSQGLIHLDITNKIETTQIFESEKPDIVLITAAKTNVESCELNPLDSFKLNVEGIENIVKNCQGKKVIFYSTDNIFDGTKKVYYETDEPSPINVYGRDKLKAESIVAKIQGSLILRSSRHYGKENNCGKYLNNIINLLSKGKIIEAPVETEGNFTFVPDLAQTTLELIKKNKSGIYHVAGEGIYSLYDAAIQVAKRFGFDTSLIHPVDKNYFNKKVKRPSSPLSMNKLSHENIKMSSLEEGLNKINYLKNEK